METSITYEQRKWRQGYKTIIGADEVGRGALAGPIVAAAVLFAPKIINSKSAWVKQIKDSKRLSPKQRFDLYKEITESCSWAVALISNKEIDRVGIQNANINVVIKAVKKIKPKADYLLRDYIAGFKFSLSHETIIKGDSKVFSIACASIVAKVYRDRLMRKFHKKYPQYHLGKNKGYGSLAHRQAIKKFGLCPLHRKSFKLS